MTARTASAFAIEEDAAEVVRGDGMTLWLLADGDDTGGAAGVDRMRLDEGADGARPHYHAGSAESFYVLAGRLEMLVGDETRVVEAGGYVLVPPGVPHAFGAAPGAPADVLVTLTPGVRRFAYFRLLPAVMRGELSAAELADLHERYDVHFVDREDWRAACRPGGPVSR